MANPEHLKILKGGVKAWNKWRKENPNIIPDLREGRFCGSHLNGVDFSRVDLRKADLYSAELTRANLNRADLRGAILDETLFFGANLSRANLRGANLKTAVLADGDAGGANLTEADLRGTKFAAVKSDPTFIGSFLDLGACIGLETAIFSNSDFLANYLARAFEYAHRPNIREKWLWPKFFSRAIKNIKALCSLYVDKQLPKQLIKVVGVITSELIKHLKKHPNAVYKIKPRQFEELIAEILASYGWRVDLTPSTRDGGYDIYAISPVAGKKTTSWIIECKKNSPNRKVGIDIVRALYGLRMDLGVANALLATTSFFSKDARAYKASRYDLELKDYSNILKWINEYRPNPNGELYIKNNRLIVPSGD